MRNKKIIIAGGTGFIGQGLAKYFGKQNDIVILGRGITNRQNNYYHSRTVQASDGFKVKYCKWDGKEIGDWIYELEGSDIVINLAGRSVNCRYHKKQKAEILQSRVNATKIIGEAIQICKHPPNLWINAASATIYSHSLSSPHDEFTGKISELKENNMPWSLLDRIRFHKDRFITLLKYGKDSVQYHNLELDFSVMVCKAWEDAFFSISTPRTRKVALRSAITLGEGGVMTPYLNLCKFQLGGKHGNGNQMYSWVHIEDVCRMVEWISERKEAVGIYNCVAPNAVTNKTFMQTLRRLIKPVLALPAPAWLLEIGAWLIRTETELMLKSRWVFPKRAIKEGFIFKYDTLEKALNKIVSGSSKRPFH